MEQQKSVDEKLTLGAYVCELGPGSACICCGAPLRWTDDNEMSRSTEWTRSRPRETRLLRCPDCGCEVGGILTEKVAAKTDQALNRAA
jgi:DNA-directed RNA polymerase subunit RPC12/RpoP